MSHNFYYPSAGFHFIKHWIKGQSTKFLLPEDNNRLLQNWVIEWKSLVTYMSDRCIFSTSSSNTSSTSNDVILSKSKGELTTKSTYMFFFT